MWCRELFLLIAEAFLLCFVGYIAAVVVHELGHAVIGALYDGEIYLLRFGRLLWVRNGGFTLWTSTRIYGAGQCLILCKCKKSFLAAITGGCALNLVSGIVACCLQVLYWRIYRNEDKVLLPNFFMYFGMLSIGMALINWYGPEKAGESDGGIYRIVSREERAFEEYRKEQEIALLLLEAGMLKELV